MENKIKLVDATDELINYRIAEILKLKPEVMPSQYQTPARVFVPHGKGSLKTLTRFNPSADEKLAFALLKSAAQLFKLEKALMQVEGKNKMLWVCSGVNQEQLTIVFAANTPERAIACCFLRSEGFDEVELLDELKS